VTPWELAVSAGNVLRLAWSMSFVRVALSRAGQRGAAPLLRLSDWPLGSPNSSFPV